jgi:hypothetical protein
MKAAVLVGVIGALALQGSARADELWAGFARPPAEARPFVRWWWNGNRVSEGEILRELDLLAAAGIGGVEINPIALHEDAKPTTTPALPWLSPEWNRMLAVATRGAHERGMVADLIVGSGWPFGGRFLEPTETIQGVAVSTRRLVGPGAFEARIEELLKGPDTQFALPDSEPPRLLFLRLIPGDAERASESVDLTSRVSSSGDVRFEIPPGDHVLYAGSWQRRFRRVMHGAPGADGPVLDHYDRSAVERYLDRMSGTLGPALGGRLGDGLRAMFCDSIELSGANWTSDLPEQFESRRGYRLDPYLPFVLDAGAPPGGPALADSVLRARYDFSRTLVELFQERFVIPFHEWCHRNGTLSRYQAYGYPWLMGMLDGYRIPDIPEGDTWLYNDWQGLDEIRYAVWNKYAASGGHLSGRRLVGCEAITNTSGVFRATLEYIKQATDLSFISGVNHLVLHGFNYSPPEAGFPGWIRYGTYLSEQNPWWPDLHRYTEYAARVASVLQQSRPVVQVAILGPEADVWSAHGLDRVPFVRTPEYLHELWQATSQAGATADYVSEAVVQGTDVDGGRLAFGPMAYDLLVVVEARSLQPATARALRRYAEAGGRLAFVGDPPSRAPGLRDAAASDEAVREAIAAALAAPRAGAVPVPDRPRLREFVDALLTRFHTPRDVELDPQDERLFQIHHRAGEREIYFFSNMHRDRRLEFDARFPTGDRTPWRWDPETGRREVLAWRARRSELHLSLEPLESMLLVFEPRPSPPPPARTPPDLDHVVELHGPWRLTLEPAQGEVFRRELDALVDLGGSDDQRLASFGGRVVYTTEFESGDEAPEQIDLGEVHGVSRVRLNGHDLGVRWWGRRRYPTDGRVEPGRNTLEVTVSTVLANYCRTLDDNAMARTWSRTREGPEKVGLMGPVRLGGPRPSAPGTSAAAGRAAGR